VVTRCKKLLTYPKKYQDLMLDENPAERVKADFFIELYAVLNDRFVKSQAWFSRDRFTQRMLEKYLTNASGFKSVTDFRTIKQHISNAIRVHKEQAISIRLRQFVEDDTRHISHLSVPAASVSAGARKVLGAVTKLTDTLRILNADEYYGEEELWSSLDRLMRLIRLKLLEAGRRPKE